MSLLSMRATTPRFSASDAQRMARELYDVEAAASALPSERDQNFLLRAADRSYVLKIARAGEPRALLECQNEAMLRLAAGGAFTSARPLPSRAGELIETMTGATGEHHVRLLEYLPGVTLADVPRHSPALLESVGRLLATTDRALLDFTHPAVQRELHWDLQHARAVIARHLNAVPDASRRTMVQQFLTEFELYATSLLPALRTSVIHGDGNDWNILVAPSQDPLIEPTVTALLDFGDMTRSWLVAEPAIAAAYAMLGKVDPLTAAASVIRGYHAELPLQPTEIAALYPLICLRLCTSVVLSAQQRTLEPDNAYLSVSEAPAWALLERLAAVSPRFAHYLFRDACGLEAVPHAAHVEQWLRAQTAAPVVAPDPRHAGHIVFDLSVGSTEFDELRGREDAVAWSAVISARMQAARAEVGIGRYDEARRWYTSEAFRIPTDDGDEWRTVHLGIDLFAPAGTPVYAPLEGVVHAVRNNAQRLDYGPTVILRHDADGVVFFTLYGHLAEDALQLQPGTTVAAGTRIGCIGDYPQNGDWAPHLHLQISNDLLEFDGTFPGVARPSQRAVWRSVSPDPNLLLRLTSLDHDSPDETPVPELLARRAALLGRNLSVSYRRPLHIVRGWMQHLYDSDGRAFLDGVNNVAHVGHSHPRVVDALARQSRVLNTNTRYLHDDLLEYAERLTATLPEPLSVCFFVCSGSEANELALRLARAYTHRRDFIVLDAAYHGNTGALVDLSPYKFAGKGGYTPPSTTHVVPLPDPYRGPHRGTHRDTGARYAEYVRAEVARAARSGADIAALLVESLPGCGGQIVLPDGYLEDAFAHVRAQGGLCIADEVQVGFGRVGSHFWGFQTQNVVPDIVTMGKPIGNGHPIGAVVTTPAIADAFANGMEYFNTFGGNPVSCSVGIAVLDVIESEHLQAHALEVGNALLAGLRELQARHPLIGDVRGLGLYLGVELVLDRETLEPAPRHATYVIERMRDCGVLLSTDGPLHNVIKIKPPLPFNASDADKLVLHLDRILGELRG